MLCPSVFEDAEMILAEWLLLVSGLLCVSLCNNWFLFLSLSLTSLSECGQANDPAAVVVGVVVGVLLMGLISLLVWKVVVTIQDRIAFVRFQNNRLHAKWGVVSESVFLRVMEALLQ